MGSIEMTSCLAALLSASSLASSTGGLACRPPRVQSQEPRSASPHRESANRIANGEQPYRRLRRRDRERGGRLSASVGLAPRGRGAVLAFGGGGGVSWPCRPARRGPALSVRPAGGGE